MPTISLSTNGQKKQSTTLAELIEIFKKYDHLEYLEYDLSGQGETSVFVLMNRKSALAVFFRYNGDSGFTTINRNGSAEIYQIFKLSNGQMDEYAENMLVDRDLGYDILKHYFTTGTLCEFVEWKEEA
jgi:hypothetical protein